MNTKHILIAGMATGLAMQLCLPAMAAPDLTVTQGASPGEIIPDDNTSGISSSIVINSAEAAAMDYITSVTVTVDVAARPRRGMVITMPT